MSLYSFSIIHIFYYIVHLRLEFRQLLRKYKTDLCFTPMIIADSFCRSSQARNNEFTTNQKDTPLVVQFAAKNSIEFGTAAELIFPYADGIDLNCGCPQSWAMAQGYGCALLKEPEKIHDMIRTVRRNLSNKFSCSIKMRILQNYDLKSTIDFCRQLEACDASFLTIHGRTPRQKSSEPVNIEALKEIKKSINIPVIVNGNVKTLDDANLIHLATKCDGVMAARGLLSNPTLFTNTNVTTKDCVQEWINLSAAADSNMSFQCFHHHLTFMTEKLTPKKMRVIFNNYTKKEQVFQFMKDFHGISVDTINWKSNDYQQNIICTYPNDICNIIQMGKSRKPFQCFGDENENFNLINWNENNNGNFFFSISDGDLL